MRPELRILVEEKALRKAFREQRYDAALRHLKVQEALILAARATVLGRLKGTDPERTT